MSRKKIYLTIGVEEAVADDLKEEAVRQERSRSAMVSKILKEYFQSKEKGAKQWPLNFPA